MVGRVALSIYRMREWDGGMEWRGKDVNGKESTG
jgi:hypothetical protein